MCAFLGVPIRAGGHTIGSLYMTRMRGAEPFSDADEFAATILALQVALAVSTAISHERSNRLLLLEERVSIGHDLHDGTIQSLYALALEWDSMGRREDTSTEELREMVRSSVEQVNDLIRDIRTYIQALEQDVPETAPDLIQDLSHVVRRLVPEGIDVILNLNAPALHELMAREVEDLLFIAREAVSNAVRHGHPTKIAIDVRQTSEETAVTVQDNGTGFDQFNARRGLGTVTMRTRADRLGAQLVLMSLPGMGTTVRITLPRASS
ncbi:MAG: GAF domain-containing sensor histidine kinase, partial [Dehalococcoidia bacterium]